MLGDDVSRVPENHFPVLYDLYLCPTPKFNELRLNASSRHGGLGHFSPQLLKKNLVIFDIGLPPAGFEPGTMPGIDY